MPRIAYRDALQSMKAARSELLAGGKPSLVLCTHPAVITCGRRAKPHHVLCSPEQRQRQGVDLVEVERGGEVTYHDLGQLMIYPVVRVGLGVNEFVRCIADVLIGLLESFGVSGVRWCDELPGLWLGDRKIAACGLHLSRGVSIHGWALNVCTLVSDWQLIVPCGHGQTPISMDEALEQQPSKLTLGLVATRLSPPLRLALARFGL